jgi:hypothetical protein
VLQISTPRVPSLSVFSFSSSEWDDEPLMSPDSASMQCKQIAGLVSMLAEQLRGVTLNASTTLSRQRREEFQHVCSCSDAPTPDGCHITKEEKVRSCSPCILVFQKS